MKISIHFNVFSFYFSALIILFTRIKYSTFSHLAEVITRGGQEPLGCGADLLFTTQDEASWRTDPWPHCLNRWRPSRPCCLCRQLFSQVKQQQHTKHHNNDHQKHEHSHYHQFIQVVISVAVNLNFTTRSIYVQTSLSHDNAAR